MPKCWKVVALIVRISGKRKKDTSALMSFREAAKLVAKLERMGVKAMAEEDTAATSKDKLDKQKPEKPKAEKPKRPRAKRPKVEKREQVTFAWSRS